MLILTEDQFSQFKNFIDSHENFIIAGHKEPDGDCISSCLGISYILRHFGKEYRLVNAGPFKRSEIKKFRSLFSSDIPFMSNTDRKNCGLIITDCSELSRLGDIEGDFSNLDTFIIDHHLTSCSSGTNAIIDSTAPAASCIVQQLYEKLAGPLTEEASKTLFFGMATDTGFFRFLNTDSSEVFKATSRLVEAGANPRTIYDEITSGKGWNTRKLLGIMLSRAERKLNGKLVVTWETIEDTHKYGQEGRDSDSLYQIMLATSGVEAVVFIRQETDHNCTLGFRSKNEIDVSEIAAKFGGGGHKNAAGGSVEGEINTLIPAIVKEFAKII